MTDYVRTIPAKGGRKMIVNVYIHGMPDPLAREACVMADVKKVLEAFGSQRIEKVIITDFRPVCIRGKDGKVEEVCPDF